MGREVSYLIDRCIIPPGSFRWLSENVTILWIRIGRSKNCESIICLFTVRKTKYSYTLPECYFLREFENSRSLFGKFSNILAALQYLHQVAATLLGTLVVWIY